MQSIPSADPSSYTATAAAATAATGGGGGGGNLNSISAPAASNAPANSGARGGSAFVRGEVNSEGISMLINHGNPVDPNHLEELDFFDRQNRIPAGSGEFVRNPLGKMSAPCGEEMCIIPQYAVWSWCCIGFAVLIPGVFYCVWVPEPTEIWSRVIVALMGLTCITLMFLGGCSEPGIVLPAKVDTPQIGEQKIEIKGVGPVTLEVCHSCKVLRPPRSSHCSLQGVCVRNYDHFCGVVGSLVAERTFRYFTLQLVMYVLYAAFIAIRCIALAATDGSKLSDGFGGTWRAVCTYILIVIGCIVTCCVSGVAGHYVQLSGTGRTLKDERGRKKFLPDEEDWSCGRCLTRLFGAMPPSALYKGMKYSETEAV